MENNKKEKRVKEKKPYKLWERIFIGLSSLMVIVTFVTYSIRLIHYYKIEHPKDVDNSIAKYIKKNDTVLSGDGLHTFDEKYYVYKGKNVNNYIWYNGLLWRIIEIKDDNLKLISADSLTTIVWGKDTNYKDSYVNLWLTNENNLKRFNSDDLVFNSFCVGEVIINELKCNETFDSYIGLLSIKDYLNAGGKDSYLNNSEYFWTSNTNENKAYYVFSDGGINNEVSTTDAYYSYGVRPVIILKNNYEYYGGDGTKESPYRLNEKESTNLSQVNAGEYIEYSGFKWRVQDKNEANTKLILDGYVNDNTYTFSNGISYLNKEFYNSLSSENLVKCSFNTGSYGKNSNYDYSNIMKKNTEGYVGVPSVGELFSNDYADIWLYNEYEGTSNLQYKVNSSNRLIGDVKTDKNKLRAVVCLKNDLIINDGSGTKESPYKVGEADEVFN